MSRIEKIILSLGISALCLAIGVIGVGLYFMIKVVFG